MSEIVTIYKINCYSSLDPTCVGESVSLLPWDDSDPTSRGKDDGGHDYVLPKHYRLGTDANGRPVIQREDGTACELMLHNGCPLLIDREKHMAHLLERYKKLEIYRTAAGMTRQELAQRIGVTQQELFFWENYEKSPTREQTEKIAEILGCDASEIP
jgi:DNA-binding XRE family transcriptional regulator